MVFVERKYQLLWNFNVICATIWETVGKAELTLVHWDILIWDFYRCEHENNGIKEFMFGPEPPWISVVLHWFLDKVSDWFVSARNDVLPYLKTNEEPKDVQNLQNHKAGEGPDMARRFSLEDFNRHHPNVATKHGDSTGCPYFALSLGVLPDPFRKVSVFCEHDGLESYYGSTGSCENWCEQWSKQKNRNGPGGTSIISTSIWVDLLRQVMCCNVFELPQMTLPNFEILWTI